MENPFEAQKNQTIKLSMLRLGVHSGKGGVGKTFISVNLAYLLSNAGFRVGILDSDIDCPNVSKFLSIKSLATKSETTIYPLLHNGVKIISSDLTNPVGENPIIIRGPIKHNMLTTFLTRTEWGELDYLIIDLPPGTADVPLSAMQLSALDGLILVTTPTKESLLDTARACNMAKKLNVPIIGLIENMSGEIFGTRGEEFAKSNGIQYLGSIPLTKETALCNENGKIAFLSEPSLISMGISLLDVIKSLSKK